MLQRGKDFSVRTLAISEGNGRNGKSPLEHFGGLC